MSTQSRVEKPVETPFPTSITRRDAIQRVTALLGGMALVGGNALLVACTDDRSAIVSGDSSLFTADEIALLDEIADTILPETGTPGAKAAAVGPFMAHMVGATYDEDEQRVFRDGLRRLDEASQEMHGASFMEATPQQRLALLEAIDQEQMDYMNAREAARRERDQPTEVPDAEVAEADTASLEQTRETMTAQEPTGALAVTADAPAHYFRMMKELALLGYFTSEIGYNQAMRYVETPGRFDPCVPYSPGDRAWAPHA
jgi:hypothetical protein